MQPATIGECQVPTQTVRKDAVHSFTVSHNEQSPAVDIILGHYSKSPFYVMNEAIEALSYPH